MMKIARDRDHERFEQDKCLWEGEAPAEPVSREPKATDFVARHVSEGKEYVLQINTDETQITKDKMPIEHKAKDSKENTYTDSTEANAGNAEKKH